MDRKPDSSAIANAAALTAAITADAFEVVTNFTSGTDEFNMDDMGLSNISAVQTSVNDPIPNWRRTTWRWERPSEMTFCIEPGPPNCFLALRTKEGSPLGGYVQQKTPGGVRS